jgi:hypothetical protein
MDERTLKSLRQLLIEDTERQVDAFDDTALTISETIYVQLREFHARCDEMGIAFLDVADGHGQWDLSALEQAGLVQRSSTSTYADGTQKSFLELPYALTVKARKILRTPAKYIYS